MDRVFRFSKARMGERLVLLSLANFANEKGVCWPSVQTLARDTLLSERQVQRCLQSLVELQEIRILQREGPMCVNKYQIYCFGEPVRMSPPPVILSPLTICHPPQGGDIDVSQMSPKPSGTTTEEEPLLGDIAKHPSDAEVEAESKKYPGNVSIGAPPGIPSVWWSSWFAGKLGNPRFAWDNWRVVMRVEFERDFRLRRPQATSDLPQKNAGRALDREEREEIQEELRVAKLKKNQAEIDRLTELLG